ncbi:MAG TPA: hypothetical protein VGS27_21665 [Candidatus Sulfotelmatobacter sp.]|nr:hypothetical protein [Candidatus Sulfotelmatobacter sp.]
MSEITEQIPNPALPEPPVTEIPAQSPELQTPEPDGSDENEAALVAEITELWRLHVDYSVSMRHQAQNLRSLRAELGKKLSDMKQTLAKPGRNGQWSGWLKERRIPRATADRLVLKYDRSLNPDGNCLNESISEPTEEEIQTLLDKVAPKLRRVLRTPASAYRFIDLLSSSLALNRKESEEGFTMLRPYAHTPETNSEVAESSVEPSPTPIDALAGQSLETMSSSALH